MMLSKFHIYLYGSNRGPIASSFDESRERLEALPGLFFEMDGSFAWMREVGCDEVYGILYDAADTIQYCDLHGSCSCSTFRELCSAISGGDLSELEVLRLPEQHLQDFQSFALWLSQ